MSSRTLIDISRLGTDTTWPSVAVEVNGYLQNWIAAANAQVSQHQLRIATAPNPESTASDPCGWRIEATLSQLTPGGNPAVLILEVFLTGTSLRIMPGIGNSEPFVGADNEQGWIYPSATVGWASGDWSTTPLPFNAQVAWSLAPGAEYFVFAYSQHRFTNRQAVPLLIARDQVSGNWILAGTPPSTTFDALRAVSWNARSGQPSGSRSLLRDGFMAPVMIRRPAELVLATTDWSYYESANEPAQFWEPLLLPPDFAALNVSSAAMSYYKPPDGSEWLAIGGHGLLLRTKDAPAPQGGEGGTAA
ncbi:MULTISPECIES: hypothetical protein [unclassified Cyanobium]|uniref:hypothetical protein n=1 Tax=unclassified Cyanobium TaxID=2627006 RepID=UPI0020CED1D7|nr:MULTISPECIES: hypothetical protein [unclassified Cyanobium]MCP9860284.1 hypothetical protein [Cyanobium sp. Cruz-8H5]MCP9867062.1 hypothetical protein [Cyanobium sp. Cruz-8D1]